MNKQFNNSFFRDVDSGKLLQLIIEFTPCPGNCSVKDQELEICYPENNGKIMKRFTDKKPDCIFHQYIIRSGILEKCTSCTPCKRIPTSYINSPSNKLFLMHAMRQVGCGIFAKFSNISKMNRKVTEYAIKNDCRLIHYVHPEYEDDLELWMLAIKQDPYLYAQSPDVLRNNVNIATWIVRQDEGIYETLVPKFRDRDDILVAAMQAMDHDAFRYASERIRSNAIFVRKVILKYGFKQLPYVSDKLKHDSDFMISLHSCCQSTNDHRIVINCSSHHIRDNLMKMWVEKGNK